MNTAINPIPARRHDLDWLRILAFALLIFYHIGMFFNSEGWHAKSVHASGHIEPLMWLSSPWRLPLLFFISGVAIRFLSDKLGAPGFARERTLRLLPVIVFGMYVVVAPQTYVELRAAGEIEPGVLAFWTGYAGQWDGPWSVHTPTWNHLWYVVYLFVYALLLAPFLPLLRRGADGFARWLERHEGPGWAGPVLLIALGAAPFLAIRFTLVPHFPTTHDLVEDWANHANSLLFLVYGYVFAKSDALWRGVDRALPLATALTLLLAAFLFTVYQDWDATAANPLLVWPARVGRVVFAWTMIMTLAGLSRRFLNRDGPARRYLTEAIFPVYILHQTIIVVAGYALTGRGLGVWGEFALLLAITVAGCFAGFELVRRIAPLRPFFGLKLDRPIRSAPPGARPRSALRAPPSPSGRGEGL